MKECIYNLEVLEGVRSALTQYRNAVNGDAPETALTFLPLNSALHIQVNSLVATGRLYEFFDAANLKRLQNVTQNLSPLNSDWFFKELERRKQGLVAGNQPDLKADTVAFLNFADGKVKEWESDLKNLKAYFGG